MNNKTWETFSIFISSTFSDMQAERDYLVNFVFPRVRYELRKRRIRLSIIDLRWGLDVNETDETIHELKVLEGCLKQIDECHPFFIGLLGDRYGTVPDSSIMSSATGGKISIASGSSITALEIFYGVLKREGQLKRSLFYFRNSLYSPENIIRKQKLYFDLKGKGLNVTKNKALRELKENIKNHFVKLISAGGLGSKVLDDYVKNYSVDWDKDKQQVINLEQFGRYVFEDIMRECKAQAGVKWKTPFKDKYNEEEYLLDAFIEDHSHESTITTLEDLEGQSKTKYFSGRVDLLKDIQQLFFNIDSNQWIYMLKGESGSGKSAIFSQIYRDLQENENKENFIVLAHSAGISPRSVSIIELLHKWNKQLSNVLELDYIEEYCLSKSDSFLERTNVLQNKNFSNFDKIRKIFDNLLFEVSKKNRVILMIDAFENFENSDIAKCLSWLNPENTNNVRLFCTTLSGTENDLIEYHKDSIYKKEIEDLNVKEIKTILENLSFQHNKSISPAVISTIVSKKENNHLAAANPLWINLVFDYLLTIGSEEFLKIYSEDEGGEFNSVFDDYVIKIINEFPNDPGRLFLYLIERAAQYFGEGITKGLFNYISCSRNGLRESDLKKLLNDNWKTDKFENIRCWFQSYLREEGSNKQWNLSHSVFRKSIYNKIKPEDRKIIHNSICSMLNKLPIEDNLRVSEIMYHMMEE
ncbi:MAG: DUF4062 domain-containing protein, partial [Candidatus Stygibacter australis]|nr:DUF4062 domain-containing protein [Candidatus Stygibacter australis]